MKFSLAAALVLSATLALPAHAGGSYSYYGPYGGYAQKSYNWNGTSASRSFYAQGANSGSASVTSSCTKGAGCSRSWSRTLANGKTASGSVTAQRGVGLSRTGTGFRGRKW